MHAASPHYFIRLNKSFGQFQLYTILSIKCPLNHQQIKKSKSKCSCISLMRIVNIYCMGNCCFEFPSTVPSLDEHEVVDIKVIPESRARLDAVITVPQVEEHILQVKQNEIKIEEHAVAQPAPQKPKIEINEIFQQMIELYRQVEHFYANHDVDSCMPLIAKIQKLAASWKTASNSLSFQQQLKDYCSKHNPRLDLVSITPAQTISQIKQEYKDILHYQQEISGGNWEESSFEKGVRLSTRKEDGSVGVLIEMELDLPFEVLISVLIDMELYCDFIPFNEISRQEKIFSRNCRIGYNLNNYPFLAKREAFFQGIGYSRLLTHKQFFLYTRSIHDKPELQHYLKFPANINPDYVPLTYKYFVVKYRPIRPGKGQLIMALNADIGLNFLPNFVLQFLSKDFAKKFVESVVDISKRFKGSKWQKNVEKNPDLFLFFKNEIDGYFQKRDN